MVHTLGVKCFNQTKQKKLNGVMFKSYPNNCRRSARLYNKNSVTLFKLSLCRQRIKLQKINK